MENPVCTERNSYKMEIIISSKAESVESIVSSLTIKGNSYSRGGSRAAATSKME